RGVALEDADGCTKVAENMPLDALSADGLRTEEVGQAASKVSAIPGVRAALLDFQRRFATQPPGGRGAILDGRDIGTVVCPDANVKLWVTADSETRALRRYAEAKAKDPNADYGAILASIRERDEREATRTVAPMKPAE